MKTNNIAEIKINKKNCIMYWLKFTQLFHKMTEFEMGIVEFLLKKRIELLTTISDENILNEILMSKLTKDEIKEKFQIDGNRLNVILSALRKKNVLKGNILNKSIIPNFSFEEDSFKFILVFKFNDQ